MFDMSYAPKAAYTSMQTILEAGWGMRTGSFGAASDRGVGTVQLTWNASAGATSYT